jgi:hypothetical protein
VNRYRVAVFTPRVNRYRVAVFTPVSPYLRRVLLRLEQFRNWCKLRSLPGHSNCETVLFRLGGEKGASACPRLQENSCWTDPDDLAAASISPGSGFSNPREHLICNDRALALVRTSQAGQSRVLRRHFGP